MKWQHIGVTLTGCAALITAGIGVYEKLSSVVQPAQQKVKREYGIVDDKDGWVNLRESPNISAPVVVKAVSYTHLTLPTKRIV